MRLVNLSSAKKASYLCSWVRVSASRLQLKNINNISLKISKIIVGFFNTGIQYLIIKNSAYQASNSFPISKTVGKVKHSAGSSVFGVDFSSSVNGSIELHTTDLIG